MDALERLYSDRLPEQVERLAHHALRGEVWAKAVAYFRQAGAKAFARSANREVVSCFEQALAALQHLPESRDRTEQSIDLRFDLRNALMVLGELERVYAYLHEAETLAKVLDDHRRLWWVSAYMTHHFLMMGDYGHAIQYGQRALDDAVALGDFALQVMPNSFLVRTYHALGDYRRAMDYFKRNVASLKGESLREHFGLPIFPAVISRISLVWCLAELREFTEAIASREEGIRMAEAVDHPWSLAFACFGVGLLYLRKGDSDKAIRLLERGLELCRDWNLRFSFPVIASTLGSVYVLSARVAEALPLLEQAATQAASMKMTARQSFAIAHLSEAYLLVGSLEDALVLTKRALDLSRDHKKRGHQAYALWLLGEIASHHVPPELEQAESHYRQSLTLAEELGMRPLMARCHLGLGILYHQIGRLERARSELSTAIELFRAMEMPFWLTRAQAALAQAE